MKTQLMGIVTALALAVTGGSAAADDSLSDQDSNINAKKVAVASAYISHQAAELADAAMSTESYDLAIRAHIVSRAAAKVTVGAVLVAASGRELDEEQKETIRAKFVETRQMIEELRNRWEQLPEDQKEQLREQFEMALERAEALRSTVDELGQQTEQPQPQPE
jgi:hypothetical protein